MGIRFRFFAHLLTLPLFLRISLVFFFRYET